MSSDDVILDGEDTSASEIELILEDEIDEVQLIEDANATRDEEVSLDDEIEIIEPDERRTLITEEMIGMEKTLREAADSFFDPQSPTNVSNLSPFIRKDMSRYAAALFEWICCLPSTDLLTELYMGEIDLPWPVNPGRPRTLLRTDLGVRLAEVWRRTKSVMSMANHFKVKEQVALLSLLHYGFINPSQELDVYPLLKVHEMSREDYHTIASFVARNCDARLWKSPDIMLCEVMMPPLLCSIGLYLMNTECGRGSQVVIPWEELDVDLRTISAALSEEHEQTLLEAFKQISGNCPLRKKRDDTQDLLQKAEEVVLNMTREVTFLKNQTILKKKEFKELHENHVPGERHSAIIQIKPDDFEENGAILAKRDAEVIISGSRSAHKFNNQRLIQSDLFPEEMEAVLARRTEDASESFQEAHLIKWEKDRTKALIRFVTGDVLNIPLSSIAHPKEKNYRQMPIMSEGVRVAAMVRHPLRTKERAAFYSGTIISKHDLTMEDYAIAFDDFFDDYVNIHRVRLLIKQPFNEKNEFDRASVFQLMTPNPKAPLSATEERKVFLILFFSQYPEWGCVKMNERVGRNVSTVHRNGEGWVAQALKVDRQMVWLRFNPKQNAASGYDPSAGQDCFDMKCKIHDHYDEKMYRGNPRLKQMNMQIHFDDAMKIYRELIEEQSDNPLLHLHFMKQYMEMEKQKLTTRQVQRHNRRQQTAHGITFESALAESKQHPKAQSGPMAQTARKCGTALHMDSAIPMDNGRRAKKAENEVSISYHEVEKMPYFLRKPDEEGYRPDYYHVKCTPECLHGLDSDPEDHKFTKKNISPYFIPIMCGWRRMKQEFSFSGASNQGSVYYRTPCGRPLFQMAELLNFLDDTRSDLTVDVFSFTFEVDETAYVKTPDDKSLKMIDLTNGVEARPIPVVNDVDEEPIPSFMYRARRYPLSDKIATAMITTTKEFCSGCDCTDDCRDWTKCACQRLTHRESVRTKDSFKNVTKGYSNRLLKGRVTTGIYECNENCGCSRKRCINRVVQNDIKIPMQMMRTIGMGWGVRALCDVPQGTFISCYNGAMLSDTIAEGGKDGDEYYADLDLYNIVENEKVSAGIDMMEDQGCFFEDVGTRELTRKEKEEADKENELDRFRKEEDHQQAIKKRNKKREEQKERRNQMKARHQERELAKKKDDKEGSADTEEEEEEEGQTGQEENGEKGDAGDEEDDDSGGQDGSGDIEEEEADGDSRDANETLDEGVLADLDDTLDNTIDEGVDEGDSQDEDEDEEGEQEEIDVLTISSPEGEEIEEEASKSPEEVKMKEVEEDMRLEELRRKENERQRRVNAEAKKRYTIPIKDEEGRDQLDAYFIDGGCDDLFLIDAKGGGNIGRQFNHGCEPNMFTQHIFVDTHDIRLPWVAFFAKRDIKAGEELCWDYGWAVDESRPRGLKCACGAEKCRVDLL